MANFGNLAGSCGKFGRQWVTCEFIDTGKDLGDFGSFQKLLYIYFYNYYSTTFMYTYEAATHHNHTVHIIRRFMPICKKITKASLTIPWPHDVVYTGLNAFGIA